jgi:hypothetical protein
MDLVFEGDRVYLHSARGHFGAVPLRVRPRLGDGGRVWGWRCSTWAGGNAWCACTPLCAQLSWLVGRC